MKSVVKIVLTVLLMVGAPVAAGAMASPELLTKLTKLQGDVQRVNVDPQSVTIGMFNQFNDFADQLRQFGIYLKKLRQFDYPGRIRPEYDSAKELFPRVKNEIFELEQQIINSSINMLKMELERIRSGHVYASSEDLNRLTEELNFLVGLSQGEFGDWRPSYSSFITPENFHYFPHPKISSEIIRTMRSDLEKMQKESASAQILSAGEGEPLVVLRALQENVRKAPVDSGMVTRDEVNSFNEFADKLRIIAYIVDTVKFENAETKRNLAELLLEVKNEIFGLEQRIIDKFIASLEKEIDSFQAGTGISPDRLNEELNFLVDLSRGKLGNWYSLYSYFITSKNFHYFPFPKISGETIDRLRSKIVALRAVPSA